MERLCNANTPCTVRFGLGQSHLGFVMGFLASTNILDVRVTSIRLADSGLPKPADFADTWKAEGTRCKDHRDAEEMEKQQDPTPQEIAERTAQIRARWSEREREARRAGLTTEEWDAMRHWTPPEVPIR